MANGFNSARLLDAANKRGDTTHAAIAKRVGIDQGSVSRYLAGTRQPGIQRAAQIARAYGIDITELYGALRLSA
jgi:transcriptional regulator with XRE-family HTH domain